jgi:hypothetical protein
VLDELGNVMDENDARWHPRAPLFAIKDFMPAQSASRYALMQNIRYCSTRRRALG